MHKQYNEHVSGDHVFIEHAYNANYHPYSAQSCTRVCTVLYSTKGNLMYKMYMYNMYLPPLHPLYIGSQHTHADHTHLDTDVGLSCSFLRVTLVVLGTRGAGFGGVKVIVLDRGNGRGFLGNGNGLD